MACAHAVCLRCRGCVMGRLGWMALIALMAALLWGGVLGIPVQASSGEHTHGEHLQDLDASSIDWKARDLAYWQSVLSAEQVRVCRQAGTERPFSGEYAHAGTDGIYACSSCGQALFSSETKFDSGTGWPSYWAPISSEAITEVTDTTLGMIRVEVRCSRCDAHLGHVFRDGPRPTGLRYCINSVCLMHQAAP